MLVTRRRAPRSSRDHQRTSVKRCAEVLLHLGGPRPGVVRWGQAGRARQPWEGLLGGGARLGPAPAPVHPDRRRMADGVGRRGPGVRGEVAGGGGGPGATEGHADGIRARPRLGEERVLPADLFREGLALAG